MRGSRLPSPPPSTRPWTRKLPRALRSTSDLSSPKSRPFARRSRFSATRLTSSRGLRATSLFLRRLVHCLPHPVAFVAVMVNLLLRDHAPPRPPLHLPHAHHLAIPRLLLNLCFLIHSDVWFLYLRCTLTFGIPQWWTADLKKFVLGLVDTAFSPPNFASIPNIGDKGIYHQSSSNYCEINFPSKDNAAHFIKWITENPNHQDIHGNWISMYAKYSSTPKERTMGRILRCAYKYVVKSGAYDEAVMKLQTNRTIGTLSIRYKGLAHVILQVHMPRSSDASPIAKRGKLKPDVVPGFSLDILDKAVELANMAIAGNADSD